MSTAIPIHEPFVRTLPRDITLREIARRNRKATLPVYTGTEFAAGKDQIEAPVFYAPTPNRDTCLCKSCRLQIRRAGFRFADQMWACDYCGQARAWGISDPENAKLRPALKCKGCRCHTRHGFLGVIGRTL